MKFQYGTKVEVIRGFYKGLAGHVVDCFGNGHRYTVDIIMTEIDNKLFNPTIDVSEDDLTIAK